MAVETKEIAAVLEGMLPGSKIDQFFNIFIAVVVCHYFLGNEGFISN